MFLAVVISDCEDELICDLAQYYGVYDYKALPMIICSTLARGLPLESRVMRFYTKQQISLTESLLACIVDGINTLVWQNTKDGHKGRHRPKSVYKHLTEPPKEKDNYELFDSEEELTAFLNSRFKEA